ncbi:hypothetical protein HX850_04820 [Marine Group I thaumarchaeote]|jgi:hypothetical protein|uniref:Uncharacterized protein n=1 Tax=Marine Group I thaumarchaeote TaxID=2511932 RepID=A0A7K4MLZ6_9ARCH|nr:hypothetical protein [Marine Group I thaumarchaeote]
MSLCYGVVFKKKEMKPIVGVCKECEKEITSFPCTAYGEVESAKEINFNWYHSECFFKYIERVLIGGK